MPTLPSLHPRGALLGLALFALVVSTSGCGLLFVDGPPDPPLPNTTYVPCTDSKMGPHLDVAGAVVQGLNMLIVTGMSDREVQDEYGLSKGWTLGVQATSGLLLWYSATRGYAKVDACQQARMLAGSERADASEVRLPPIPLAMPHAEGSSGAGVEAAEEGGTWHPPMRAVADWPTWPDTERRTSGH